MNWNASMVATIITAVGFGGVLQAAMVWLRDRKKIIVDVEKTDVETKLAYLNTVIERLDAEAKRSLAERDRVQQIMTAEHERLQRDLQIEQERNATLRKRVHDLEDEIDGVRRSARDTQQKCDELATRLKVLVDDAQEK